MMKQIQEVLESQNSYVTKLLLAALYKRFSPQSAQQWVKGFVDYVLLGFALFILFREKSKSKIQLNTTTFYLVLHKNGATPAFCLK